MDKNKQAKISLALKEILLKESSKAKNLFSFYNSKKQFNELKNKIRHQESESIDFKAEHIFLFDFITIINSYSSIKKEVSKEALFLLIYFYELVQGKNLFEIYNDEKISELLNSKEFLNNIEIVLNTKFFKPKEVYKDELIFPSLLQKLNLENKTAYLTLVSRLAATLVKIDGKISSLEEEFLVQINKKLNTPKIILDQANINEIADDDSLEKVMEELNQLVGLVDIKKNVEDISNFLKVQKMRMEKNLKTSTNSLHAVFMGAPGTGKTTVARLLGRIYKHLGYLKKGHLIETDRSGLVAGFVGQTAIKTDEIINSALGGVLFIDEAYSLASKGMNDFGNEAIEILLKRMEDYRDELVVVVAGYSDEMETFIQSNPGLQSRFNRYFDFKSFSAKELMAIFQIISKKNDFKLTEDAEEKLLAIWERVCEKKSKNFGNARSVRNLFENIIENQANRIVAIEKIDEKILITIEEEDIPPILKTVEKITQFVEN